MDRDQLFQLIKRIITGSATKQEEEKVNRELFDSFISDGWDRGKMGDKARIQERILTTVSKRLGQPRRRSKTREIVIKFGKIAAVVTLFSVLGFYGLQFMNDDKSNGVDKSDRVDELTSSLKPGGEKALLTLNDGTILNLEDLSVGEKFANPDFTVIKTGAGNLEYRCREGGVNHSSEEEWTTLSTPMGGKFQIVLADGTKVWLNAESTLSFPKQFSGDIRRVKATGELYFEVSADKNRPFIVNTKEMDIRVLGTSFNVSTYEDNAYPKISLLEGAVQVKTESSASNLMPGQRASIENTQINIGDYFDVESEIAWKNDYFIFKNKNIKEIMSDLARWYGAEVAYQGENWADKNYTIRISRRENIGEILSIIELTESVKFKVNGRRIVVIT